MYAECIFAFFIKLTQGEWGLADPTQWQCKLLFAKNVRHLLQRKVFGSLSKGQIMRDFIIWKEICILNVFLLFHKTESRRMRSHWLNSMTVQAFICKNVRHLLQRKVFGFLSKGQIMRDFIIWKEIWKTLNKEKIKWINLHKMDFLLEFWRDMVLSSLLVSKETMIPLAGWAAFLY